MTDPPIYYPWQIELMEWARPREQATRGKPPEPLKTLAEENKPKAKMSNLLKFARAARARPEIWSKFQSQYERVAAGETIPDDEENLGSLCGEFARWYRIKNGIDDHYFPWTSASTLLWAWAGGEIDENDEAAARAHFSSPFTEDDLEAAAERQTGSKAA